MHQVRVPDKCAGGIPVKGKIGESYPLDYRVKSLSAKHQTYDAMAQEFLDKYLEYKEKAEHARMSFWDEVQSKIICPKTAHLQYDYSSNNVTIVKDERSKAIQQKELELLELELRIKQLRKRLGKD